MGECQAQQLFFQPKNPHRSPRVIEIPMHWNALEAPCPMNFQIFQIIYYYLLLLIIDLFFLIFLFFPFFIFFPDDFPDFLASFFLTPAPEPPVVALETPIQPNGLTKVSCDRRHLLFFSSGMSQSHQCRGSGSPQKPDQKYGFSFF